MNAKIYRFRKSPEYVQGDPLEFGPPLAEAV